MKCPVCQSTCFEEENGDAQRCLDCLAVVDNKGTLIEVDGVRAEGRD